MERFSAGMPSATFSDPWGSQKWWQLASTNGLGHLEGGVLRAAGRR
ncbi:hypothetical protein [Rhodococcus pyridinivorans]